MIPDGTRERTTPRLRLILLGEAVDILQPGQSTARARYSQGTALVQ